MCARPCACAHMRVCTCVFADLPASSCIIQPVHLVGQEDYGGLGVVEGVPRAKPVSCLSLRLPIWERESHLCTWLPPQTPHHCCYNFAGVPGHVIYPTGRQVPHPHSTDGA